MLSDKNSETLTKQWSTILSNPVLFGI